MGKIRMVMAGAIVALFAFAANAALLDYEGFDYGTNKLAGMTGGTGWGSAWSDADNDTDLSDDDTSLSFAGFPTAGDRVLDSGGADAKRNLDSSFVMNAEGNVRYISMLVNKGSIAASGSEWMELNLANGSNVRFKMGVGSDDKFYVEVGGDSNVSGTKTASAGTTYLLVAKITSSTNQQTASLKVYAPGDTIDESEPVAWDVTDTGFTGYNLYMLDLTFGSNLSDGSIDEIRVSDTWMDAISDPPPDADGDGMDDTWETTYFGSTNAINGGSNDDWDADGMVNLDEFIAGTVPTNSASLLILENLVPEENDTVIQWQAVDGKSYSLLYTASLTDDWMTNATGIAGMEPSCTYTTAVSGAENFFKIIVVQ